MSETTKEFDATDRPDAGTACVACRAVGHFCPAKGHRGQDALCLACGNGEACEQAEAVLRMQLETGFYEMEIDQRGLHGECRQIAIAEADRVQADAPVATAWTIKASLSAANLETMKRARPGQAKPGRVRRKKQHELERERDAGRRRRMSETNQDDQVLDSFTAESGQQPVASPTALCACGRPAGHTGRHKGSTITKAAPEAKKAKKASKPSKALVTAPAAMAAAPVDSAPVELLTLRLPAAAMDKLILMLPTKIKVAAVEKLMVELAGA